MNNTACCWFPTSSNILILPSQFWQIRFESYWLHCSKCRILVLLRYTVYGTYMHLRHTWKHHQLRNSVLMPCDNERVSTGHLVLPRILSPASPRILLLPDVFLLSNKIRSDAGWCGVMRGNLQNVVNQEVAYHKVTDQVARALPYGNVNNQDGAHQTEWTERDTQTEWDTQ